MSSDDFAVRVNGLGKCYRVYDRPEDRLKEYVFPRLPGLRRLRERSYSKEFWALRDICFEIRPGETLGIIGRNGSGKSTLLELICGTSDPTCGTIEVNGRVGALLELGAGFNLEFSGLENVYLGASIYGLSRAETDRRVESIAAFADIGDFLNRPVKTYSSGMYLRLAFALVAHIDADILIVDEALSVGDTYFVQKCMRFLRDFMKRGTLLFVSHDLGAVANLCDRAILLNHGAVETAGKPKIVLERYLAALCEDAGGIADKTDEPSRDTEPLDGGALFSGGGREQDEARSRSQIHVFGFHPESTGFGTGHARIVSVSLQDDTGCSLTWATSGTLVNLQVVCSVATPIDQPIVGFQLKDRLGQVIFGENTFLDYQYHPPGVDAGGELEANFAFRMPVLPTGDYSFSVAIAEGTQDAHVQHHWLHDAFLIQAHSTSTHFGLVGIPMARISLVAR